ncbi:MAG: DUF1501 domain-containing protein [Planctomycetota bacterium]|nr:MAG: DUF1501 domain-containing protein [Planctomycetota bacterium]
MPCRQGTTIMTSWEPMLHVRNAASLEGRNPAALSRRGFLQAAALATGASPFLNALRIHAAEIRRKGKACILVWLAGAPSQIDTWDPKTGTPNAGSARPISTKVPGIQVAHYWPKMAQTIDQVAILRTVRGKEAAHERGTYHLHTGRRLGTPEKHPNFGSVVADKLGDPDFDLPNFVSIGQTVSSGFLGVRVAPFIVDRAGELPRNVKQLVSRAQFARRLRYLQEQEAEFAAAGAEGLVAEHQTIYQRAVRLMQSPRLKAFQLADEPQHIQKAYGSSPFQKGLLVARRLVEAGVPFVEVRRGGWDMHNSIEQRMPPAAADVDQGLSQLLRDLKQRGMLQNTLVVCMGEFGRTPKINSRTPAPGRDHWARNFCILLAGGGVKGGRVVGKTSRDGTEIVDREIQVEDFFQTWARLMGIDPDEELYTPSGRPLKIVDGGTPIQEIL